MITIIILFAVAAVFGLTLLVPVLQGKTPKLSFALVHGGVAAVALVMLILQWMDGSAVPPISLILFVVAALGGFVLIAMHLQKKTISKPLAVIHAGAAVVAFLMLLFAIL